MVQDNLMKITRGGDLDDCTPEKCHIPIDSTDEIGESAHTFNSLVDVLSASLAAERTIQDYTKMLTSQLELESLTKSALSLILKATGSDATIRTLIIQKPLQLLSS